jgi:hypothetical protein
MGRSESRAWLFTALAAMFMALCAAASSRADLNEETLPAEEMPSPTAAPSTTPVSAEQPTPAAAPAAAPTTSPEETSPEETPTAEPPTPAAEPSPVSSADMPPTAIATSGATPDPAFSTLGEPPPIDLDATPTPPVSAAPLTGLIDDAATPARAASLRDTEEARQEIADGKAAEAIHSLTGALSIDSSNPYAYFYLGRAYALKKDCHQALTFLQRAELGFAADPPWLGETLSFEGACYEESGQTTQAVVAYKHALDSSPYNLMARVGYGRLVQIPQPEAAVAPAGVPAEPNPPGPAPANP